MFDFGIWKVAPLTRGGALVAFAHLAQVIVINPATGHWELARGAWVAKKLSEVA